MSISHIDDDVLALLALGEDVGDDVVAEHLASCPVCRAELDELREVVRLGRDPEVAAGLEHPPAAVWDRVAAEIEHDVHASATLHEPAAPREHAPLHEPATPREPATVHERTAPSWWRRTAWVAAASFALGVAGTAVVSGLLSADETEPAGTVLASAELAPLPGWSEQGVARVAEVEGRRVLTVELPDGSVDGFREVWLIDTEVQRLVSVGLLAGDEGTFELPEGLDIEEFPIVDVSREPYDGDPAHSGDSIVRGQLA